MYSRVLWLRYCTDRHPTVADLAEHLSMSTSAASNLLRRGQAYLRSVAQTHGLTPDSRPWTEVTRLRVVVLGCIAG